MLTWYSHFKRGEDQASQCILKVAQEILNLLKIELDEKEKTHMKYQDLQEEVLVLKQDREAHQSKMKEMQEELEEKDEKINDLEALNQTLLVKERRSNDELQESRKESIKVQHLSLQGHFTNKTIMRIKVLLICL